MLSCFITGPVCLSARLLKVLLVLCLWVSLPLLAEPTAKVLRYNKGAINGLPVPPYLWYDQCRQQSTGLVPHMVRLLVEDLGYQLDFKELTTSLEEGYSRRQLRNSRELLAGESDVDIQSMLSQPNQDLLFSDYSIIRLNSEVVYRKQLGDIQKLKDLAGYNGVISMASKNSAYQQLQQILPRLKLQEKVMNSFDELARGEIDFIIGDHYIAALQIRQLDLKDQVGYLRLGKSHAGMAVVLARHGPHAHLMPKINQRLAEYQEQNLVDHLANSYLNAWLSNRECLPES